MAPTRISSYKDGPRLTVNQMVKEPTLIPKRILSMLEQDFFMMESVFRNAGGAPGGAALFYESEPLFADSNPEIVEEYGEIPVITDSTGKPLVAKTVKRGGAIMVSQEMINRNNVDRVNQKMTKLKNSFAATFEDLSINTFLGNASIPTLTAGGVWGTTTASATANVYVDLYKAMYNIMNADADTSNGTGVQKFGFKPNTIVLNTVVLVKLLNDANVTKVLQVGDAATRQPFISGASPDALGRVVFGAFGLNVIGSWRIPADKAIVCEAKTVGGYVDEVPLGATPLYEIKSRESWRADVTRTTGFFIDQPKAALIISGVNGGSNSIANL